MSTRIIALASILSMLAVAAVLLVLQPGGSTAEATPPQAAAQTSAEATRLDLALHVDEHVRARLGDEALAEAIEVTLEHALGTPIELTVARLNGSLGDAYEAALTQAEADVGLTFARSEYARVLDEMTPDSDLDEVDAAAEAVRNARGVLEQVLTNGAPLVAIEGNRLGIEITNDSRYGARRTGNERWASVGGGLPLSWHSDDNVARQSIANAVVQGLGLLAGLEHGAGAPELAMTGEFDLISHALSQRDSGPVTFTDDQRARVLSTLASS